MSVDVIGQFARKSDATAWLEGKWRYYATFGLMPSTSGR